MTTGSVWEGGGVVGGKTFWITECPYPPPFPRFRLSLLGPVSFFFGINKTHTFRILCWQPESVRLFAPVFKAENMEEIKLPCV
jgi:hypothetical protein